MTEIVIAPWEDNKSSFKLGNFVGCTILQQKIANVDQAWSTRFFSLNRSVPHCQSQSLTRNGDSHFVVLTADEKPTNLTIASHSVKATTVSPELEFLCSKLATNTHTVTISPHG
jgi:hypothetical protein